MNIITICIFSKNEDYLVIKNIVEELLIMFSSKEILLVTANVNDNIISLSKEKDIDFIIDGGVGKGFAIKKVVDEINELSKAFIIEEKPVETNEDEAIEILIGSLLNSGIPIEKVFSTTLLELNLRNKAIKYQLSKLKEMKI
jgi:hypothetical protein